MFKQIYIYVKAQNCTLPGHLLSTYFEPCKAGLKFLGSNFVNCFTAVHST